MQKAEMFVLPDGTGVQFYPNGPFHGWLFRKHPDGQWVSVKKLDAVDPFEHFPLGPGRIVPPHGSGP